MSLSEFSKKSKLQDLVEDLSEKYWKYKGFIDLESKGLQLSFFKVVIYELFIFRFWNEKK